MRNFEIRDYPVRVNTERAFERGRKARRAEIGRNDAPYRDPLMVKAWVEGWDLEYQTERMTGRTSVQKSY